MAIPERIKQAASRVRNAIYGQEVRESIAKGLEASGDVADEAKSTSEESNARSKDTQHRFDDQIEGTTNSDEVIDARRPEGGETYQTLRERLDTENQEVNAQLAQTTREAFRKRELEDSDTRVNANGEKLTDFVEGTIKVSNEFMTPTVTIITI